MVFIEDEVGDYKLPVDSLWRYNRTVEQHTHANRPNLRTTQEGNAVIYEFDSIAADGTKELRRMRVVELFPVGQFTEELEGRFAGSKYITYYVPKGNDKTEVHTVGEWISPTIPADKLKDLVKDYLDKLYDEDKRNVENYRDVTTREGIPPPVNTAPTAPTVTTPASNT